MKQHWLGICCSRALSLWLYLHFPAHYRKNQLKLVIIKMIPLQKSLPFSKVAVILLRIDHWGSLKVINPSIYEYYWSLMGHWLVRNSLTKCGAFAYLGNWEHQQTFHHFMWPDPLAMQNYLFQGRTLSESFISIELLDWIKKLSMGKTYISFLLGRP